jgi:hypothetical protein
VWKAVRIGFLLLVLGAVALHQWLDRVQTQSWRETLWVGIYPLNADGTATAAQYIDALSVKDFAPIESFFAREAHRYGVALDEPVHIELYPQGDALPPALAPDAGPLGIAWWSLKLRWFAWRVADVPDSHGLQKGLVGVVHAFAEHEMTGANDIVIAHELLHTLGATDKYDPASGAPLYPSGYADPDSEPRYPQAEAEIMAGRRALSAQRFDMPQSLASVVVGPETAREIRWTRQ